MLIASMGKAAASFLGLLMVPQCTTYTDIQSLTIIMLSFFTQRSLRNITFLTLRFFHLSIWQGALTFAFSSTSVNLPLCCFSLGGALTFAFSRSVVRSLAGPRARSLARLAARPLARPLARPEVARPPARASARPLSCPLALVRSLQTLFTRANFFGT